MFILEARNVTKWVGDRLLFSLNHLRITHGEKIGIVGRNGAGKTTLLRTIAGEESVDEGNLSIMGTIAWIKQDPNATSSLSGGEETKQKISQALNKQPSLLLADEPTSHLDIEGVQWLEKQLIYYHGTLLLISHDRKLLNAVCTRILEVDGANTHIYSGNYYSFLSQKKLVNDRVQFEYQQIEKEKKRLIQTMKEKKTKTSRMNKPPKRMSTSESRLYKAGKGSQMAKVDKQTKAIETRIAKLEQVEKTNELPPIHLDLKHHHPLKSKTALRLENISKYSDSSLLFKHLTCSIPTGSKVAIIGKNGTGKSTFLQMIAAQEPSVTVSPQAHVGFFHQKLANLEQDQTILENVSSESNYPESTIRTVLAHLYFSGNTIFKQVSCLSGGERVKVLLAKIFLSDANVLLLDEPTNFLDIPTREELENVLASYPGTILFASHDRQLISTVANHLIVLENGKAIHFSGTYAEYIEKQKSRVSQKQPEHLLLHHELTEVISRLSLPLQDKEKEALEQKYQQLLKARKQLSEEDRL